MDIDRGVDIDIWRDIDRIRRDETGRGCGQWIWYGMGRGCDW